MWMLSLEWLCMAVLVFWVVGAAKRLRRLRAQAKQAFVEVDEHLLQLVQLLRSRAQDVPAECDLQGDLPCNVPVQHARHALLPCAELLHTALLQARQHPLLPEAVAALEGAWQSAQVAWQAYMQLYGETATQPPVQAWGEQWTQLNTLHYRSTERFNTAVQDYNQAIAQFPACAVARCGGLRAGRIFQKDAAWQMQPTA